MSRSSPIGVIGFAHGCCDGRLRAGPGSDDDDEDDETPIGDPPDDDEGDYDDDDDDDEDPIQVSRAGRVA